MVCQPINRAVKENLSYSQTQAIYDKAYCSANMTDFTDNLIRAETEAINRIPGVTVLGIKGKPKFMYQRYFPIALAIQAIISYLPVLLWILWCTEELTIAIIYIAEACKDLVKRNYSNDYVHSTPKPFSRAPSMETRQRLGELDCQINHWLDQKFLSRSYITKLVVTELLFIFILICYFLSKSLYVSSFKSQFVCRVDDQSLVSCTLPVVRIYKMVWYANILIIDICILLTTLQFMNILCCMLRQRQFFFLTYMGIEPDSHLSAITDAHLISYFCQQNLSAMPPDILVCQATWAKMSKTASSTLISFGETESDLSDESTHYYTATNTPNTRK
jgi:hypothetical protein